MGQGTRGPIGKEDFAYHDPAAGTAAQTFNRTTSTGGTTAITKSSAVDWPLRDAVVVTGGRTPFESLADTQAAKNVENALADIRKNIPHYKNVDHYGMIPGIGASAGDAAKNTEIFQRIITDITSESRIGCGVYFPGYVYAFAESGGAMPTVSGQSNVVLAGVPGSLIYQHSSVNTGLSLLNFINATGVRIVDLGINRNGTLGAGTAIAFTSPANSDFGNSYILNCTIEGGANNISMIGDASHIATGVWVVGNRFLGASGFNVLLNGITGGHLNSNYFATSGNGIVMTSAVGNTPLADTEIVGNDMRASGQGISLIRSGAYNPTYHRSVALHRNQIASGNIVVNGINKPYLLGNELYSGQIAISTDFIGDDLRVIDNNIYGAVGHGLDITGTQAFYGFQIRGGTIRNATQCGIHVGFANAALQGGTIQGVSVIDCSRQDSSATDFSGMLFDGTGGLSDSMVSGNVIRCFSGTAINGNLHSYGIDEAGSSNRNIIGPNYIKGYQNADVRIVGAASLDVVAAVTVEVATYTRHDGTGAV